MISYNNYKIFTVLYIKEKDSNSGNFNNTSNMDNTITNVKYYSIWSILIIALVLCTFIIFKLFKENSNFQDLDLGLHSSNKISTSKLSKK